MSAPVFSDIKFYNPDGIPVGDFFEVFQEPNEPISHHVSLGDLLGKSKDARIVYTGATPRHGKRLFIKKWVQSLATSEGYPLKVWYKHAWILQNEDDLEKLLAAIDETC